MADWNVQGADLWVADAGAWRKATAQEVVEAVASPDEDIRRATGLRFGRIALTPAVLLRGTVPDAVQLDVGVRRGPAFIPVPGSDAQGIIQDSRWHPLDLAGVQACFAFLNKHGMDHASELSLGSYLELKADPTGVGLLVDETEWDDRATSDRAHVDFPKLGLGIELFPYQQSGVEFLVTMAERDVGALLADQMGLGKTAQAIALLLDQHAHGPSLVICPASLMRNWAREIAHVAPALSVTTHAGPLRTGVASGLTGHDVVITTYDTSVSDLSFLTDVQWNVLLLDEAQTIRNPETARARSVKALDRRISVALTGTPVENRLLDLWSIAEFVVPALLGTKEAFEETFPDELERAESLGEIISPVTLRRLVAEVATDLPELIEMETAFELPQPVAQRYAEIASESSSPLAATTALRVLCAHADEHGWEIGQDTGPKVEHTMRIVSEAFSNGEKVLLFASFQEALDRLYETVKDEHPDAFLAVVDGRVPVADRQTILDLFTKFPGPGVLFMNPQAAGVGLNITAANHVIHFNPEWNPALTSQATARAYRRKQTLPVTVHHLFYESTVEEDALLRSEWKRALAGRVDDGTAATREGLEE